MISRLKKILLPLVKPFLPLIYRGKYRELEKKIRQCFTNEPRLIFFFPAYHMGGAEKIHLEIMKLFWDRRTACFICYKSLGEELKEEFKRSTDELIDFNVLGNYPYFQRRLTKLIITELNRYGKPLTILGCNVFPYYDIVDGVENKLVRKTDLLHAFSPYINGVEERSILSVANLDHRIVINEKTKEDYRLQYTRHKIEPSFLQRIHVIYNPLHQPAYEVKRSFEGRLKCLWVARGSKEKRPWIFVAIAKKCREMGMEMDFSMVGDVDALIPGDSGSFIQLYGSIGDETELKAIYRNHHVLLTTSVYEGFPLTITEAISEGLVNIATAVGGIPEHLKHGDTGFLVADDSKEKKIVEGFVSILTMLNRDREILPRVYGKSLAYINSTFSFDYFCKSYRSLLINE